MIRLGFRVGPVPKNRWWRHRLANYCEVIHGAPAPPRPPLELEEANRCQMVGNYYTPRPRPVVIKTGSPLHDKIFDSPSFAKCRAKVKKKAAEISSGMGSGLGYGESVSKSGSADCIVGHIREMFTLGKSYVTVTIDCTSVGICFPCDEDNVIPSTGCTIKYAIRDSFKDPLDVGIEPGGTVFPMDGDFEEDWGGCSPSMPPTW